MMDVSGSMGDEQKEIVRIESFWIDAWLKKQYKGLETRYIIHDAVAREVDRDTFFRTRESGGTMISSAYKLAAQIIDAEVRRLIDEAYTEAKRILTKYKKEWIAIAEGLLEYETLSGDEIRAIIKGDKPARDLGDDTPTARGTTVPKAGARGEGRKKGGEPEGGMEPQPSN